jgi:hypothetical protein
MPFEAKNMFVLSLKSWVVVFEGMAEIEVHSMHAFVENHSKIYHSFVAINY